MSDKIKVMLLIFGPVIIVAVIVTGTILFNYTVVEEHEVAVVNDSATIYGPAVVFVAKHSIDVLSPVDGALYDCYQYYKTKP